MYKRIVLATAKTKVYQCGIRNDIPAVKIDVLKYLSFLNPMRAIKVNPTLLPRA